LRINHKILCTNYIIVLLIGSFLINISTYASEPTILDTEYLTDIRISPDGQYLLTRSDHSILIYRVSESELVYKRWTSLDTVNDVWGEFSPDSEKIVLFIDDQVFLGNTHDFTFTQLEYGTIDTLPLSRSYCSYFSRDSQYLLTTSKSTQSAYLYETNTGELLQIFGPHPSILSAAYDLENNVVVTSSYLGLLKFWDPITGVEKRESVQIPLNDDEYYVILSPLGTRVLIVEDIASPRTQPAWQFTLVDIETTQRIFVIPTIQQTNWIHFTPDGSVIVFPAGQSTVLHDGETGQEIDRITIPYDEYIISLSDYTAETNIVVCSTFFDGPLLLFDASSKELIREMNVIGFVLFLKSTSISPNNTIMTRSGRYIIHWNPNDSEIINSNELEYKYAAHLHYYITHLNNQNTFLTKDQSDWALFDAETLSPIKTIGYGDNSSISEMIVSPSNDFVLTVSKNTGLEPINSYYINLNDNSIVHILKLDSRPIETDFSPDGIKAIFGTTDRDTSIWDLQTGTKIRDFAEHTSDIQNIQWIDHDNMILVGLSNGTVEIYDAESAEKLVTVEGNSGKFDISDDYRYILVGTHLYDAQTYTIIHKFDSPADCDIEKVEFFHNENRFYALTCDLIYVWDFSEYVEEPSTTKCWGDLD
jgi:WD40 repeat protein